MITLYTWGTPNGRKISILLEELGVSYETKTIDIDNGGQFDPEFLKIAPNNKIPAIVDHDAEDGPLSLFESGAILIYLADKFGQFLPAKGNARYTILQWLMWQMSGLGPMFGQLRWFVHGAPEPNPVGIERFHKECARLLDVLEKRLSESAYVGGEDYSIADIAIYPWIARYRVSVKAYIDPLVTARPFVSAWLEKVARRDAVQRGMTLPRIAA